MKVGEVCRSLPGRLCQKDQECTALLRSSLSRHSCQTPAIIHTCQTPWIILNTFWVHSFWILQISCFNSKSIAFTKGFSWPVVSDDNGHDYHDAGFCLFQIVSEVNWTACQLCIVDMSSNLNWHFFIWNYKRPNGEPVCGFTGLMSQLTVGTYSDGNLFVVYEMRRQVFPTAPSPTTTHCRVKSD